jgi:hypothetical protein
MLCQAEDFDGRTICARCRLEWAAGAAVPDCKPKAVPPVAAAEMAAVLRASARDIIASQRALIAAKFRLVPHDGEMRRAVALRTAAELIERVAADAAIVERLRREEG